MVGKKQLHEDKFDKDVEESRKEMNKEKYANLRETKFEKRIKRSTTHASGRRTRKTMEEKWLIKKTNSKKEYDDIEKKVFFKYKKI